MVLLKFAAAQICRGIARREQQIGHAAEHRCRSDFRDTCAYRFGQMSGRAQRMPGYIVNAVN